MNKKQDPIKKQISYSHCQTPRNAPYASANVANAGTWRNGPLCIQLPASCMKPNAAGCTLQQNVCVCVCDAQSFRNLKAFAIIHHLSAVMSALQQYLVVRLPRPSLPLGTTRRLYTVFLCPLPRPAELVCVCVCVRARVRTRAHMSGHACEQTGRRLTSGPCTVLGP